MEDSRSYSKLTISSVFRDYQVQFVEDICTVYSTCRNDGDVLVIDKTVAELFPRFVESTPADYVWVVEPSENEKSYEGVLPLLERLIEGGFRKNHRLFAVGGGIVQDVTSFLASILYRGVDWIFLPTNVLSQCDSCIGSKTSINFRQYKNQLGGFYPPAEVYIDTEFLNSLGELEYRSGLGEMLHYCAVTSSEDVNLFLEFAPKILRKEEPIDKLMFRSLEIKKNMIEIDEFDQGPRNVFNYGHSFGHALESSIDYSLPHGVCVAFGIDLANLVSTHLGLIDMKVRNRLREACEVVYDGIELPDVELERYFAALSRDKKNVGDKLGLILTEGEGNMYKKLCDFDDGIKSVIQSFFEDSLYLKDL